MRVSIVSFVRPGSTRRVRRFDAPLRGMVRNLGVNPRIEGSARASRRGTKIFGALRVGMFAGRNHGATLAPAIGGMKFVVEATTLIGGIKLGTVRRESTPRARTESTFPITQATGRQEKSKRAMPSRLKISPRGQHGVASSRKAASFCEDQGGPQ